MERVLGFFPILILCWVLSGLLPLIVGRSRRAFGWLLPAVGVAIMLGFYSSWSSWERLGMATAGMIVLLKGAIFLQRPLADVSRFQPLGLFAYLTFWPGMDPAPFKARVPAPDDAGAGFAIS